LLVLRGISAMQPHACNNLAIDKEFPMSAVFATHDQVALQDCAREKSKDEILARYGVVPSEHFNVQRACEKRISYLKDFLRSNGRTGFVLGISGGVDSTT